MVLVLPPPRPAKSWFDIPGTGTNWDTRSRGEKGITPFQSWFPGKGTGETLTRLRGHSGGVALMKWWGVKGLAPELPPAKGAGRGTAVSMVPSSLVGITYQLEPYSSLTDWQQPSSKFHSFAHKSMEKKVIYRNFQ